MNDTERTAALELCQNLRAALHTLEQSLPAPTYSLTMLSTVVPYRAIEYMKDTIRTYAAKLEKS